MNSLHKIQTVNRKNVLLLVFRNLRLKLIILTFQFSKVYPTQYYKECSKIFSFVVLLEYK